jgi:hypothetical protein
LIFEFINGGYFAVIAADAIDWALNIFLDLKRERWMCWFSMVCCLAHLCLKAIDEISNDVAGAGAVVIRVCRHCAISAKRNRVTGS